MPYILSLPHPQEYAMSMKFELLIVNFHSKFRNGTINK